MALCPSLDKVGPICRSVADTALVLSVLNGGDAADRGSITAGLQIDLTRSLDGLRVGYLPETFDDPGATEVDRAALDAVRRLGVAVVPMSLPDLPYGALINVLYAEAAATFEALTLSGEDDTLTWQDAAAWPNTFRKARFLSAVDHVQLDRLRYQAMLALDGLFRSVDVLVGPFSTGPMLVASNFTGHPCLHLRAGFLDCGTRSEMSIGSGALATGDADAAGPPSACRRASLSGASFSTRVRCSRSALRWNVSWGSPPSGRPSREAWLAKVPNGSPRAFLLVRSTIAGSVLITIQACSPLARAKNDRIEK